MQWRSTCRRSVGICVVALLLDAAALAQQAPPPRVVLEPDGTVHVPAQSVPVSGFLSPAGKAYLAEHLQNLQRPELLVQEDGIPPLLAGYIARQRELFPVDREDSTSAASTHTFTRRGTGSRLKIAIACSSICTAAVFANAGPRARSSSRCRLRRSGASRS